MPLKIPTLDDRTYADLVREGIERIPAVAPEWTNHNASDPGITLLELFAYVTEIYLYRVDRVTAANKAKVFKLLRGIEIPRADDAQLRTAIRDVRTRSRAVTALDFEHLSLMVLDEMKHRADVATVHCFPRRDLSADSSAERRRDRPGHVTVVIVPSDARLAEATLAAMADDVKTGLEPYRLITCRLHVVPARYVDVAVRVTIAAAQANVSEVERNLEAAIREHYVTWSLGRSVYSSDLYRRLAAIGGVLRVLAVEWTAVDSGRLIRSDTGDVVGIRLEDGELPRVTVSGVRWDLQSR